MNTQKDLMDMVCTEAIEPTKMSTPNLCPYCGQFPQNCSCKTPHEVIELLQEALDHEKQTHETLGAILGTDDSLERCAERMKKERDDAKAGCESLNGQLKTALLERDYSRDELRLVSLATHYQANCIQQCAAHIGPDTSATIIGLPRAVKHLRDSYDELREFVRLITLQLQTEMPRGKQTELFHYAYRMYVKHEVEK